MKVLATAGVCSCKSVRKGKCPDFKPERFECGSSRLGRTTVPGNGGQSKTGRAQRNNLNSNQAPSLARAYFTVKLTRPRGCSSGLGIPRVAPVAICPHQKVRRERRGGLGGRPRARSRGQPFRRLTNGVDAHLLRPRGRPSPVVARRRRRRRAAAPERCSRSSVANSSSLAATTRKRQACSTAPSSPDATRIPAPAAATRGPARRASAR